MAAPHEVKDNRGRARAASLFLCLHALVQVVGLLFLVLLRRAAEQGDAGGLRTAQFLVVGGSVATSVILIGNAVAFVTWMVRAYANALALGANDRWSARWAVLGWFVPVLNVFLPPVLIANTLANAEDLTRSRNGSVLVLGWWICWIAANVANLVASPRYAGRDSRDPVQAIDALSASVLVTAVATALTVTSLACAIALVRRITALQPQAALRMAASVFDEEGASIATPGRQVVGMECAECARKVTAALDVVACRACQRVFHGRCARTVICNACGADQLVRGVTAV